MNTSEFQISLSKIDQDHFGHVTASASFVGSENIPEMLEFCKINNVEFLIARCGATDLEAVQRMESEGFQLMDTLLYYRLRIRDEMPFSRPKGFPFRPIQEGEEEDLREAAEATFKNYSGHYHSDKRLDSKKCDEVYSKWAYQASLSRGEKKEVLVNVQDGKIACFVLMEINSKGECVASLAGVRPEFRRIGIYGAAYAPAIEWTKSKGLGFMHASTQLSNIAQQRYLNRFGFEPRKAVYTLHKWFD